MMHAFCIALVKTRKNAKTVQQQMEQGLGIPADCPLASEGLGEVSLARGQVVVPVDRNPSHMHCAGVGEIVGGSARRATREARFRKKNYR